MAQTTQPRDVRASRPSKKRDGAFRAVVGVLTATIVAFVVAPTGHAAGRPPAPRAARGPGSGSPEQSISTSTRPTQIERLVQRGRPIFCGGETKPLVALTFDDGPGVLSPQALQTLREHHATATFFLVGKLLDEPWLSGILQQEVRFGAAFGDHTWDHVTMAGRSASVVDDQIDRTRRTIEARTHHPVFLFRPPLGLHAEALDASVRSKGMLEILWSIDTGDSQGANADQILRQVREHLSPGDIVLMHDNRGTTEKALPHILDLIQSRGYTTVTVPQLVQEDPPSNAQVRNGTCS